MNPPEKKNRKKPEKKNKIFNESHGKVAIMAVKITIAVEKTAKDQDLEIGETLNITVATKGESAFFYFS